MATSATSAAAKPCPLDPGPQHEPALQVHDHFGLPGGRACGDVVEVEVVLVLARLDVEVQVALVPARAAAAGPHPEPAILEEILVPGGCETHERLGMLSRREAARQQPQRLLVDLRGAHLQARVPA